MQPRTPRSYALAVPAGDYPRKTLVPVYIDIHTVHGGATVDGVTQAHTADLKTTFSKCRKGCDGAHSI
jgi:hypothetical protein